MINQRGTVIDTPMSKFISALIEETKHIQIPAIRDPDMTPRANVIYIDLSNHIHTPIHCPITWDVEWEFVQLCGSVYLKDADVLIEVYPHSECSLLNMLQKARCASIAAHQAISLLEATPMLKVTGLLNK
jgi:hypothetical protein